MVLEKGPSLLPDLVCGLWTSLLSIHRQSHSSASHSIHCCLGIEAAQQCELFQLCYTEIQLLTYSDCCVCCSTRICWSFTTLLGHWLTQSDITSINRYCFTWLIINSSSCTAHALTDVTVLYYRCLMFVWMCNRKTWTVIQCHPISSFVFCRWFCVFWKNNWNLFGLDWRLETSCI